jgi:hypothetical protein
MVWFGKHSVAYVIYVPAALAGLLLPYAWAFTGEAAAQSAASALGGISGSLNHPSQEQNGFAQNGIVQDGGLRNGHVQNGRTEDHAPDLSLGDFLSAQLRRRRLSEALMGERHTMHKAHGRADTVLTQRNLFEGSAAGVGVGAHVQHLVA